MSYIEKTLSKNERVKLVVKLSWCNYVLPVLAVLFSLLGLYPLLDDVSMPIEKKMVLVVVDVWFGIWGIYKIISNYMCEMAVTNKRVICRTGIFDVETEELKNEKIESIKIEHSILGSIFSYATIYFSGTGTTKISFNLVDNPVNVKKRIEDIIGHS